MAHVARSKIYREHFAWSSEFDFAHHETPLLPLLLLLGGRYKVEEGWDDGDKSCDRNDSAKLLLARIRARNCPSLVVRLARCRSRPRAGRRRGRGVSSTQILRATPLRGKRQCPSPALNHARVRVAIGLLILWDCPRGAASRRVRVTLFAVSLSCGGACRRGRRRPRPAAGVGRARPRLAHAIGTRWPAAATTLSAEGTASPRPRLPASSPVSHQDLFPLPRISAPPDVGSPVDRDPVVFSIRFVSASFSNDSSIGDVLFFFFEGGRRDLFKHRDESFLRRH